MKQILGVYSAPKPHWVGDGFPVRSMFTYNGQTQVLSPFLMLDYAGPTKIAPAAKRRGVGEHPHRVGLLVARALGREIARQVERVGIAGLEQAR